MAKRHQPSQRHSPLSTTIITIAAIIAIVLLAYFFAGQLQKQAPVSDIIIEEAAPAEELVEEPAGQAPATGEASSMPPTRVKAIQPSTRSMRYQQQEREEEPLPTTMETRQNITVRKTTTLNATYRQEARVRPMT